MVVATPDMLGARAQVAAASTVNPLAQDGIDFHLGDALIHEDHGLGVLRGCRQSRPAGRRATRSDLNMPARPSGSCRSMRRTGCGDMGADAEALSLDRLDGSTWAKRRGELDRTIAETARQLVQLAEQKGKRSAPVLDPPVRDYERLAAGFPYSETAD